jgi:hypothetical protein
VPVAHRAGHEGRVTLWPWSDRGRSRLTRTDVIASLRALADDARMRMYETAGLIRLERTSSPNAAPLQD